MSARLAARLKPRSFKANQFPAFKVKFSALWIAVALPASIALLELAVGFPPAYAESGSAPDPVFRMDFSHPGLSPSHWTLTIHPNGSGHFQSERGKLPAEGPQSFDAPDVDRDIRLSAEFAQRVFSVAGHRNWSKLDCDSHLKVAFQGWKKFSYSAPEGGGACEFNYSQDKEIQALEESLTAVAETIVEGARLEMLLQHDRLGLDKEMESLTEEVREGRAQQLCVIRGILERLAEEPGVLERVRKRARVLEAKAEE
jgi:hypothetical protein